LDLSGRTDEAIEILLQVEQRPMPSFLRQYMTTFRLIMQKRLAEARAITDEVGDDAPRDPCAKFYFARALAAAGDVSGGLAMLGAAVEGGFLCFDFLARDPWLAGLRGKPEFAA